MAWNGTLHTTIVSAETEPSLFTRSFLEQGGCRKRIDGRRDPVAEVLRAVAAYWTYSTYSDFNSRSKRGRMRQRLLLVLWRVHEDGTGCLSWSVLLAGCLGFIRQESQARDNPLLVYFLMYLSDKLTPIL